MRRRDLSPDEAALWGEVAKSVKPIRKTKAVKAAPSAVAAAPARPKAKAAIAPRKAVAETVPAAPKPGRRAPSPFEAGDPKLDRKARRGRIAAERTLDLHGLTQTRAAERLLQFLESARADGVPCVRVITGKGAAERETARLDAPERGVLRRRFLEWVEAAPYRAHIARITPAERGARSGAFYVFVKSRRR